MNMLQVLGQVTKAVKPEPTQLGSLTLTMKGQGHG